MSRPVVAACLLLFASLSLSAADSKSAAPKPLWELEAVPAGEKSTVPGWVSFSPDGRAVVAVVVREGGPDPQEYVYGLRVWDAKSRTSRFTAELGRGRTPSWGDDLASFPTDDTVQTGGESLVVRNLEDGKQVSSRSSGGTADHAVWAVPDLRETFHLRREPDRDGRPIELAFRSVANNRFDEFGGGRRFRGGDDGQIKYARVDPPRPGLRPQSLAMNPGRTRLAVSFLDESGERTKARHSLVLYRILTVEEFDLVSVGEATNPHPGPVSAVTFAKDGKTLASGGEDGSVCLWDVARAGGNWVPRATVTGASGRVTALAFRPDWRVLAAVTWDRARANVWLIDADTGSLLRAVRLDRELTVVAWSPDGRTLLTGGYSGKLCAWDADALLKGE